MESITSNKGVYGELIVLPTVQDSLSFQNWLINVKGKIVLVSMKQPNGRPDYNWKEYATDESFENMKKEPLVKRLFYPLIPKLESVKHDRNNVNRIETVDKIKIINCEN